MCITEFDVYIKAVCAARYKCESDLNVQMSDFEATVCYASVRARLISM